ncbi:acyl-CoA thioesterase [Streptomyces albipurpureus]|uniref:acyl-CoA thioesterase n=1 Tax=Streptomyces albipurpureus TaxID=2897419 RepID=UPI002556D770|nr:acyl-CoA thioesterase domain-containing protein [Streptomyces sp. CWNU-1]
MTFRRRGLLVSVSTMAAYLRGRRCERYSFDHAMWFHRPFRADEWFLYDQESPISTGGRGLARGRIYDREGRLLVSVVQEGLFRKLGG